MALSVLERIAANIETTLGNLTTQNGYSVTIKRARRVNEPAHLQGYIFQLSPSDIADGQIGSDEWRQAFAVVVYVSPVDDDPIAVDTYNNDISATIYQALMSDYTRGHLAINTIIQPTLYFPPVDGSFAGITFMFDVHYRTALDKPYVSGTN